MSKSNILSRIFFGVVLLILFWSLMTGAVSLAVIIGAVALGLLWALMTTGVYISFRVLTIPDLTVEGSIVLGAATASVAIAAGIHPLVATMMAMFAGTLAGLCTGLLHTKLHIPPLLSGILSMIALYSVNIRVMGFSANISLLRVDTVFTPVINMGFDRNPATIIVGLFFVVSVVLLIYWFFNTEIGNALRATGNNETMAKAQGINTGTTKLLGLALANTLVGLSGGLMAQYFGFSDVQMGQGAIVIGLASLFIGEVLFAKHHFMRTLVALVLGAITYRVVIALVLAAGMRATDLNLFTAITVAIALFLPHIKNKLDTQVKNKKEK